MTIIYRACLPPNDRHAYFSQICPLLLKIPFTVNFISPRKILETKTSEMQFPAIWATKFLTEVLTTLQDLIP